ncbi:hypothetical protein ACHAWO_008091 [Cyclotella atomus]|uniref:Uncharacterized protein n=1 Tax=Cyclotella atomus TaxID=382360 RepID=A0ABD3PTK1_9STRA
MIALRLSSERTGTQPPAAASAAIDILNSTSIHDSMDSGSSVGEASLVEEVAIDEIDLTSGRFASKRWGSSSDYEMNDADGLEIPQMGRQSKESSHADDSSAGLRVVEQLSRRFLLLIQSLWNHLDANMVDVG